MRPEFDSINAIFEKDISGALNMVGIADNLHSYLPAVDLFDLYRHSLVASVSALDTFVHSLVRTGILLQLQGKGPVLASELPISIDLYRRWHNGDVLALREIELQIREAHSRWSMQDSKSIAQALRLVCSQPTWLAIANDDSNLTHEMKSSLDVVVQRRNKIVHESDIDPSTEQKWFIDSTLTRKAIDTVCARQKDVMLSLIHI